MSKINRARILSADRRKAGAGFEHDKTHRQKLIIVAGPTASGKSDLAIRLARRFNGEIISADSRQVYRGMDIGTGKVERDSQKGSRKKAFRLEPRTFFSSGIRHHLIDIASPARQYSVARFKRDAKRVISGIVRRGKLPIICGGTGFWIDSLVYGQSIPDVKPDMKLRARLRKLTASRLFARLQKLDPARAAAIDRHNPVRLIRALEIIAVTGKPVPAQVQSEKFKVKSGWNVLYLGITKPMPELKRRIEKRLDARLKTGMVAEVRRLHASGVSWKRLESFGLEYRHLARYLQGKYEVRSTNDEVRKKIDIRHSKIRAFEAMRSALLRDIVAYAKRQHTWWRKNRDIVWVSTSMGIESLVRAFLR